MIEKRFRPCPHQSCARGDRRPRWSLIVYRDIMFGNRRHFRELRTRRRRIAPTFLAAGFFDFYVMKRLSRRGGCSRAATRFPAHRAEGNLQADRKGDPAGARAGANGRLAVDICRPSPELATVSQVMKKEGGPALYGAPSLRTAATSHLENTSARGPLRRAVILVYSSVFEQVAATKKTRRPRR